MAFQGTPAAEQTERAIVRRFSHLFDRIGQYNRRYIGGTRIWSQHAYGNALDIMVGYKNYAAGDVIYAWLVKHKEELGIRTLLWRVTAHYDHIHVDFWPRGVYTPSTSSTGVSSFRYSSGKVVAARIQLIAPEKVWDDPKSDSEETNVLKRGAKGPAVKKFQIALENQRPNALPEYGADGDFGPETESAVKNYQGQAGLPQTGVIDGVVGALLLEYVEDMVSGGGGTTDEAARATAKDALDKAINAQDRLDGVKAVL